MAASGTTSIRQIKNLIASFIEEGLTIGIEYGAVVFGRYRMISPVFQLHALTGEGDQNGSTEPLARFFRQGRASDRRVWTMRRLDARYACSRSALPSHDDDCHAAGGSGTHLPYCFRRRRLLAGRELSLLNLFALAATRRL